MEKKPKVDTPQDQPKAVSTMKFMCMTCDRGFKTEEKYKEHVSLHVRVCDKWKPLKLITFNILVIL